MDSRVELKGELMESLFYSQTSHKLTIEAILLFLAKRHILTFHSNDHTVTAEALCGRAKLYSKRY